jgi:hypothetical protein
MLRIIFAIILLAASGVVSASTITYLTEERYVEALGYTDWGNYIFGGRIDATPGAGFDATVNGGDCGSGCYGPGGWSSESSATQQSALNTDSISVDTFASAVSALTDLNEMGAYGESVFDISFSLDQATTFAVSGYRDCYFSFSGTCDFTPGDFLLETSGGQEVSLDWQLVFDNGYDETLSLDSTITLAAGTYHLWIRSRYGVYCDSGFGCFDFAQGGNESVTFAMTTVVPIPSALLLFPSALAVLGWVRRRSA